MTHPGELLSALLDGELIEHERNQVTEHLATCAACRNELEELHFGRAAIRSLPVLELPPGLTPVAGGMGEVVPFTRRPPVWVAAAAAAILALFVGIATIIAPPTALEVRLDQLSDQYGARTSLDPAMTPRTPVAVMERVVGAAE